MTKTKCDRGGRTDNDGTHFDFVFFGSIDNDEPRHPVRSESRVGQVIAVAIWQITRERKLKQKYFFKKIIN